MDSTYDGFNAAEAAMAESRIKIRDLTRQLAAANERAAKLEKALSKLVTVTNGVTAPHRHRSPISKLHLDRLCEVQLDCERILEVPDADPA